MINVKIFKSIEALISQTVELLKATLSTEGNLMLSGGATPYTIYNQLAAAPCPVHPERKLFLSDERLVPFDSEQNNAHNLTPMLQALKCTDRFIRINTALSPAEASSQFEIELQKLSRIDLGFLGMGSDGHTAGFFTTDQARTNSAPLTLHTNRPDGMQGVSVTPALLHRVEKIILLVTGEAKQEIIQTLLKTPLSIPAGIALSNHPNVELWTDQ